MTDTIDKVAFAAAELLAASEALASAAAEIDALRAEVARQTAIAVDHCARADVAERMVAELRSVLDDARAPIEAWVTSDCDDMGDAEVLEDIDAALSRTEAVAGRWVPVEVFKRHREALLRDMDRVGADVVKARAERDAAIAARDEAEASLDVYEQRIREIAYDVFGVIDGASVVLLDAIGRQCHRERIERDAAERARDEVGIQLAAAQAEIARMRRVVDDGRRVVEHMRDGLGMIGPVGDLRSSIAALDAVPGDALAPRITAALEASGIDSANVKGVE